MHGYTNRGDLLKSGQKTSLFYLPLSGKRSITKAYITEEVLYMSYHLFRVHWKKFQGHILIREQYSFHISENDIVTFIRKVMLKQKQRGTYHYGTQGRSDHPGTRLKLLPLHESNST